jgi:AraC-like DNA-binding protein
VDEDLVRRVTMSLVQRAAVGHDRKTGSADSQPTAAGGGSAQFDAFRSAVARLRLEGAVFLRAEYGDPWAYESLTGAATAHILRPGTDRVILFHVVARGSCWVQVAGEDRHWASAGDVIVLPYGDQHRMGGVSETAVVSLASLMEPPPWQRMPVIRHGQDGSRTDIVCGFLHSTDPLFDPRMRAFPTVFVVRPPAGPAADWVRANVNYALAQTDTSPLQPDAIPTRLPEMLLVEVLQLHLASAPAMDRGWLAGLHDPVLSPALAALHSAPARRWTVADLARTAAVSRSQLDDRFRQVLGRSPIRYLTEWRLHLARDLLASTDLGVAAIARRVGYDAEEAFSRAFKRAYGQPPTSWRAGHPLR